MERYFLFVFFFSCLWQNSRFLPLGCCSLIFYQISIKRFFKSANQHGLTEPGCDSLSSTRPHVSLKVDDTLMPLWWSLLAQRLHTGPRKTLSPSRAIAVSTRAGLADAILGNVHPGGKLSLKDEGGGRNCEETASVGWEYEALPSIDPRIPQMPGLL